MRPSAPVCSREPNPSSERTLGHVAGGGHADVNATTCVTDALGRAAQLLGLEHRGTLLGGSRELRHRAAPAVHSAAAETRRGDPAHALPVPWVLVPVESPGWGHRRGGTGVAGSGQVAEPPRRRFVSVTHAVYVDLGTSGVDLGNFSVQVT